MASPVTVATSLAVLAAFFAATLHVAASYLLPDPAVRDALLVGPVTAAAVAGLQLADQAGPVILAGGAAADLLAIGVVYDVSPWRSAALTALHVVLSVVVGLALRNLVVLVT